MATVPGERLGAYDGFRVESRLGLVGWVEETWLGPAAQPAAFAVRTLGGQRGLLLAEDVEAMDEEDESVLLRPRASLLELGAPRIESLPGKDTRSSPLLASWSTTGATLEPPPPPGPLRAALLAHGSWQSVARPSASRERPLWQIAVLLYVGIAVLATLFIVTAFAIAAALS